MSSARRRHGVALAARFGACPATVVVGGLATATSVDGWYRTREKPAFTPPDAVFGPAWGTLFVLMAVAAGRVGARAPDRALLRPAATGLLAVVLLEGLSVTTAMAFWRPDRPADRALVPCAARVGFVPVLTAAIRRPNRDPAARPASLRRTHSERMRCNTCTPCCESAISTNRSISSATSWAWSR